MNFLQRSLRIVSAVIFPAAVIAVIFNLVYLHIPCIIHCYFLWSLLIFIILNWSVWGKLYGIVSFLIISLIIVYASLITEMPSFLLEIISAFICILFLALSENHIKNTATSLKLKTEDQEHAYNLLLQEYKKQYKLERAYHRKTKRFTRLREIAKDLSSSLVPEKINKLVVSDVTRIIENGDIYFIWEVGEDMQTLALKAMESPEGVLSPESISSDEFNLWMMRHRQPLIVTDAAKDYRFDTAEFLSKFHTKSLIMTPVITADKIMGILRIDSFQAEAFSIDDLRLLAIIANISALTIHNAKLFKQTEYLAQMDGLTDLYVKRYFWKKLQDLFMKARASGGTFSILLMDLDKFKNLNDRFGHPAGDKVLQKTAYVIKEKAGRENISARYGGEEFVVLLPDITKAEAGNIAENIRDGIEKTPFSIRRQHSPVTISIGVAEFSRGANGPEQLIDAADKALYRAKNSGRNRVVIA